MTEATGFPPLAGHRPTHLILGSMPGRESLARRQYYAHPRNAFWPIMRRLFDLSGDTYPRLAPELAEHGIAVWDVLRSCIRQGSLDSSIQADSIVTNDFAAFFARHCHVSHVYFNGAKAHSIYRRHVLPELDPVPAGLPLTQLPSTSPAHAAMSFEKKLEAWKIILE